MLGGNSSSCPGDARGNDASNFPWRYVRAATANRSCLQHHSLPDVKTGSSFSPRNQATTILS